MATPSPSTLPAVKPRYRPSEPCAHLLADVPDAVLWDPDTLPLMLAPAAARGRPAVCTPFLRCQVYRWLVVLGRRPEVAVPDVLLAQLVWGARATPAAWPRRWRQTLRALPPFRGRWTGEGGACPAHCPIHGRGVLHGHFRVNAAGLTGLLGRVARLAVPAEAGAGRGGPALDFTNPRGVTGLRAVYLPPLLFAAAPRSRITPRQGLMLCHLAGQVTRTHARVLQTRPDKAQVFASGGGGLAADDPREYRLADCPLLAAGGRYVAFNGNRTPRMRNKPHGYGLRAGTRAEQAGYPSVGACLADLDGLGADFGLAAGGYDPKAGRWYTVPQLRALGAAGRDYLLRVYGPADYRARWRAVFLGWLGFDPQRAADAVATGAEVARVRARHRAAARPVAVPVAPPPPPDFDAIRANYGAMLGGMHWQTGGKPDGERPALLAGALRQSDLPAVVKYVAAVRLKTGAEGEFLDVARAEYAAHPAEWGTYLEAEARYETADGPVRSAAARLMPPAAAGVAE